MGDRLPWMPLDVGEYLASTAHLSTEQHGAYQLLRMHYWINGRLPDDDDQLAAIVRLSRRRWDVIKQPIALLFIPGWAGHERLDRDLEKAHRVRMQRKISGAKGGFHSAVAKARSMRPRSLQVVASGLAIAQANADRLVEHTVTQSQSHIETTVELAAARATATEGAKEGACRPSRPSELSRAELDAQFEARRKSSALLEAPRTSGVEP